MLITTHLIYSEEGIISVMNKIVKMHKESILSFTEKGRPENAADEQAECDVIVSYLPQQFSPEEVNSLIEAAIAKIGATSVKDMGKVMIIVVEENVQAHSHSIVSYLNVR